MECVKDALVPVTVIVNVPWVAGRLALIVMVDPPVLPSDEGLKLMLTPFPWPDADKETELLPPESVIVIRSVAELPRETESEDELAEIEKSAVPPPPPPGPPAIMSAIRELVGLPHPVARS